MEEQVQASEKPKEATASEKPKEAAKPKVKLIYILGAVVIVLILLGVGYMVVSSSVVPVVGIGDTIKVNYTGSFTNGTVFDSSVRDGRGPLEFTVGADQVIPGFDQAVIGMKLNEEKTVTIPANEAYGPVNPDLIIEVPKSTFGNQTILTGMHVNQSDSGHEIEGIVTAVNSTTVTIDFNPPLAGQILIFNITVVSIQKKS